MTVQADKLSSPLRLIQGAKGKFFLLTVQCVGLLVVRL